MSGNDPKTENQPLIKKTYTSAEAFYQDIPIEGSLGILAYGASGILAWKQKRREAGWVPPEPVPEKEHKRQPGKKRKKPHE